MGIPIVPEHQDPRILDLLERVEALEDAVAALSRVVTDNGARHDLDDVIAEDYPDPPYLVN